MSDVVIRISERGVRFGGIALVFAMAIGGATWSFAAVPNAFTAGDVLSAQKVNQNFSNVDARLAVLEKGVGPVGTIIAYGGPTTATAGATVGLPAGYLPCDGRSLSRAQYPLLFAAIGTVHGAPDAASFRLPDLRGRFVRGVDNAAGRDPDRAARVAGATGGLAGDAVGSVQSFATQNHTHVVDQGALHNAAYCPGSFGFVGSGGCTPVSFNTTLINQTDPNGETRPANVNVNYLIRVE